MAKKLPLLISTLTVLAGLGIQTPVNAIMDFEEERPPEWSAIELFNHSEAVYKRILNACRGSGEDPECINGQIDSIKQENNEDSAFLYLRQRKFIVPVIDYPGDVVKFIYVEGDLADKLQGANVSNPVKDAYFGWMNGIKQDFYSRDFTYLYEGHMSNTQPFVTSLNGSNPTFAVTNQIVSLKGSTTDRVNRYDTIIYSIVGQDGSSIEHRQIYFGGCLESGFLGGELNTDGMECRAMMNGRGDLVYRLSATTQTLNKPINEDFSLYASGYEDGQNDSYATGYEDGRNDSYDDGYNNGVEDGHAEGYTQGYNEGLEQGYEEGESSGYDSGYVDGHESGYSDGRQDGYNEGHSEGWNEGYIAGYEDGYNQGLEDGRAAGYTEGYNQGVEDGRAIGYTEGYNQGVEDSNQSTDNNTTNGETNEDNTTDENQTAIVNENLFSTTATTNTTLQSSSVLSAQNTAISTLRSPETGDFTRETAENTEFTWWLGAIFATGLAALLWIFWPNRKKSSKNPKK